MEIGETRNRAITAEEHRHADTEYRLVTIMLSESSRMIVNARIHPAR